MIVLAEQSIDSIGSPEVRGDADFWAAGPFFCVAIVLSHAESVTNAFLLSMRPTF
jgi:hypothetical protein